MTALKAVLTGVSSFVVGFFTWYGLYFLLAMPMGDSLSSREEIAFKVGYFAIAVGGGAVAMGVGWYASSRWRLPSLWTVLIVLLLIGLAAYPLAGLTSFSNDCAYNLQWPIDHDFCD